MVCCWVGRKWCAGADGNFVILHTGRLETRNRQTKHTYWIGENNNNNIIKAYLRDINVWKKSTVRKSVWWDWRCKSVHGEKRRCGLQPLELEALKWTHRRWWQGIEEPLSFGVFLALRVFCQVETGFFSLCCNQKSEYFTKNKVVGFYLSAVCAVSRYSASGNSRRDSALHMSCTSCSVCVLSKNNILDLNPLKATISPSGYIL